MSNPNLTDHNISTLDAQTIHPDKRLQQLRHWLQQVFKNQTFTLESLQGDASARRYHRIWLQNTENTTQSSYMVMDSADEQDAMQQFIMVAKLMAPAINVPTLIAQDIEQGFLVLHDFGSVEFAHLLVNSTPTQVNDYYQWAMQTLISLQQIPIETARKPPQLADYDAAILTREMDLFSDWFLPYIGVGVDKTLWENLKSALMTDILAQPQVIVHRDYHSRNLMQDQDNSSQLGVIDFQDALIGAYSYDLVSLLRDAYVDWSKAQVAQWITDFWQLQQQANITTASSAEQFYYDVNIMGVQRHLKVLGIFIRLYERDGKNRYLSDIPKVMSDLLLELEWLAKHSHVPMQQAILSFNQWLLAVVLPAYQQKFVQQYI